MDNKGLIITGIISIFGLFFMPSVPIDKQSKKELQHIQSAEKYLDELKSDNQQAILKMKDSLNTLSTQKPRVKIKIKIVRDTIFLKDSTW